MSDTVVSLTAPHTDVWTIHDEDTRKSVSLRGINTHREPYESLDTVLERAKELVINGRADERIRQIAVIITKSVRKDARTNNPDRRNFDALADAIYDYMKEHIEYVRDPYHVERIQSPDVTLRLKSGDCDDMSILGAALLSSIGVPTKFKVVSTNPNKPDEYSHIYIQYYNPRTKEWKDFDVTLGTEAGDAVSDYRIFNEKFVDLGFWAAAIPAIGQTVATGADIITGGPQKRERTAKANREAALAQAQAKTTTTKWLVGGGIAAATIITIGILVK